jgi:ligand-binding SRPBCC domain-containing protein
MSSAGHVLDTEMWVPAPIDEVWDFFKDSKNLKRLTPEHFGITVEAEGFARDGQQVRLILAPFGLALPLNWTAEISQVIDTGASRQFTDTQISGPFAHWKHTHRFEAGTSEVTAQTGGAHIPNGQAGTWLRDHVEYDLPAGPAGELAHKLFARRNLEGLFAHRRQVLWSIFGQPSATAASAGT